MRKSNLLYYMMELKSLFSRNKVSSLLSFTSLTFIFLLLMMGVYAFTAGMQWVELLKSEAEVAVFYEPQLNPYALERLEDTLVNIDGVLDLQYVSDEKSFEEMEKVLGDDAYLLDLFEFNPFQGYFALTVDITKHSDVIEHIRQSKDVAYVRDNADVIQRMKQIIVAIQSISIVVGIAVVFTTWIVTSHIIREGVQSNKSHIETLQLLGAPQPFIWTPYVLQGGAITALAATFASLSLYGVATWVTSHVLMMDVQAIAALKTIWVFIPVFLCAGLIISYIGVRVIDAKIK